MKRRQTSSSHFPSHLRGLILVCIQHCFILLSGLRYLMSKICISYSGKQILWRSRPPTCSRFLQRSHSSVGGSESALLMSAWSFSARPPPPSSLFPRRKSCMFVTELLLLYVCVCALSLSLSILVSSLFLLRRRGTVTWFPRRSKVNVSFSCVVGFVVDSVFIIMSWFHCERACKWWDDCLYYKLYQQGASNLSHGRFSQLDKSSWWRNRIAGVVTFRFEILCCQTKRGGVCKKKKQLPVLDMIYFDKKRLKWMQCRGVDME